MTRSRLVALASLTAAALAAAACGQPASTPPPPTPTPAWHGALIQQPPPKPDITLTDTSGQPFDLRTATQGKVVLLYFGYTHCPDQCPADMASLANAMKQLTPAQRGRVAVVFITTDPQRDTAPVLRTWLDRFDKSFIGLIGTTAQIAQAQRAAGVQLATTETAPPGQSGYYVDHFAVVLAYGPDGNAHEAFPGGVSVSGEAADIGRMADGETP